MAETAVDRRLDAAGRGGTRPASWSSAPMAACRRWSPVALPSPTRPNPAAPRAPACAISGGTAARSMTASSPGRCRGGAAQGPARAARRPRPPARGGPTIPSRDGLFVGPVGDLLVGTYLSGQAAENGAGDGPEAMFQDLAAQVAKARPAPVAEAREGARDTGTPPARPAHGPRRPSSSGTGRIRQRPARPPPCAGSRG